MSERTDRELLELAAKAAGISGGWGEVHALPQGEIDCTDLWFLDSDDQPYVWNPITDDGDALRLAVKLEISVLVSVIHTDRSRSKKWNAFTPNSGYDKGEASEFFGVDSCASCRRAIVRAAAEIGAKMQS